MNKNLKRMCVLLITVAMIFSSSAAIASTGSNHKTFVTEDRPLNPPSTPAAMDSVIWDNGVGDNVGMIAAQFEAGEPDPLDAYPADDFMFEGNAEVNTVHWQGGYYNCQHANGSKDYNFDWNVSFYEDNGFGYAPGAEIVTYNFPNASVNREFWYNTTDPSSGRETWYANYTVDLPATVSFDADTKYWISIYGIGTSFPQSGWCRHNETVLGILLHEGVLKSDYFGFPDWTNMSDLVGEENDFNYQLIGEVSALPEFEIDFGGGFGISATITNIGDADANNVSVNIKLDGGLIIIGRNKTKNIGTIAGSGGTGVASSLPIGIGGITIKVSVSCDEGANATKNASAFILLFLVLGVT